MDVAYTEAVAWRRSIKMVFGKILQNAQENCAESLF